MAELLINRVERNIKELKLDPDRKYGVAFSGGPDSVFLLHSLSHAGFKKLHLLYVNYHDSPSVDKEEKMVKAYAHIYKASINIASCRLTEGNFENEARIYRYNYFSKCTQEFGLSGVFVAHHQDDSILTYLMQKKRGGLVERYGIADRTIYKKTEILRPLLCVTKKEILGFLKFNNFPYYDDLTNNNLDRTRNELRIKVLPNIDREKILKEMEGDNAELAILNRKINPYLTGIVPYSFYYGLAEEERMYFLRSIKKPLIKDGIAYDKANIKLAYENLKKKNSTALCILKGGLNLYRNYEGFYFSAAVLPTSYSHKMHVPGIYEFDEVFIDMTKPTSYNIRLSMFPLTVRSVEKDDVFSTDIVNKSVFNFLKTQKVPKYLRETYPVISDKDGNIVYVPFYKDLKEDRIPMRIKNIIL